MTERREHVHGRLEAATFGNDKCALKLHQLDATGQAQFLRGSACFARRCAVSSTCTVPRSCTAISSRKIF